MLPYWYGLGAGLEKAVNTHGSDILIEMNQKWPFFRRLLADAETSLAITDLRVARNYSKLAGELHEEFFPLIEAEFSRSVATVLQAKQQNELLETNATLQRLIRLRNPYVDPMSLLQVELLRRWRSTDRQDPQLLSALLASVNGISRGLQNTG